MELHNIIKLKGNKGPSKRVGRGAGSGKGFHTSGRGSKGQKARSGKNGPICFEGGQTPIYKRLPTKSGFNNPRRKDFGIISLSTLEKLKITKEITPITLVEKGVLTGLPKYGIKILGNGTVTKPLTLKGFLYTAKARQELEKVGSKLVD